MSKIRSLSFPDTNDIDMSGGRFEIYSSEIIDTAFNQDLTQGFDSAKWTTVKDGLIVETYNPYVVELGGSDPSISYTLDDNIDKLDGVYGAKFKFELSSNSDSGVFLEFIGNESTIVDQYIEVYFTPMIANAGVHIYWEDGSTSGNLPIPIPDSEANREFDIAVAFLDGGRIAVLVNGVEVFTRVGGEFVDAKIRVTAIIDGGPYPEPSFFTPVVLYNKPYISSTSGSLHHVDNVTYVVPDSVRDGFASFPFIPSRPGKNTLRLHGIGAYSGQSEDFEIDVVDSRSDEDSLRFLVSPIEKFHHDSEGLLACRTHGVRQSSNAGSMMVGMECICDGTAQDSKAVHMETTFGGDLRRARLDSYPEFLMVDKTTPSAPKKYGRDYSFVRIHNPDEAMKLLDSDYRVKHLRTLILENGNRLYYGIRYKPEETFNYIIRFTADDPGTETLHAEYSAFHELALETFDTLPVVAFDQDIPLTLQKGCYIISALATGAFGMSLKKTSTDPREMGKAYASENGVPFWNTVEDDNDETFINRSMSANLVFEAKESKGGFFYILLDKCGNLIHKSECPELDVDLNTDSFSVIEDDQVGIRFFYLRYDGTDYHKDLFYRYVGTPSAAVWTGGRVMIQHPAHAHVEPTSFFAFDMVKRENGFVDIIYSQHIYSSVYYSDDFTPEDISAALGPNTVGGYRIISTDMSKWLTNLGIMDILIVTDRNKRKHRSCFGYKDKRWRSASYIKTFNCALADKTKGNCLPERVRSYYFSPAPCFIRANYDKESRRVLVSMLQNGDRAPMLVSGVAGVYTDLDIVETNRDAMMHGFINDGGLAGGLEISAENNKKIVSGVGIRSIDSAFGPDGRIYTVCSAYKSKGKIIGVSEFGSLELRSGSDRFNSWISIIDPYVMTASGDTIRKSDSQTQKNVPMFNIYGTGFDSDEEIVDSISIASDNQYLILGIGSLKSETPMIYQSTNYDTAPLPSVMDEVWIPEYGEVGLWEVNGVYQPDGSLLLMAGEGEYKYLSRTHNAARFIPNVDTEYGAVYHIRFDATDIINVPSRVSFTIMGHIGTRPFRLPGEIVGNIFSVLAESGGSISIPVGQGIQDLYLVVSERGRSSDVIDIALIVKSFEHYRSLESSQEHSYDFRRDAEVRIGESRFMDNDFSFDLFEVSTDPGDLSSDFLVYEVGWSALNSQKTISRPFEYVATVGGVETKTMSRHLAGGSFNTSKIGNAIGWTGRAQPSLPFTMSAPLNNGFRSFHWPNGFKFKPEYGATVKGDSTEISRQIVYDETVSPSVRIHDTWRSASDDVAVYIWADSRDSNMDSFSINSFIVSGANVPRLTLVAKQEEHHAWEEIGVFDLTRYVLDGVMKSQQTASSAVYTMEDLNFNLGKFEDTHYYIDNSVGGNRSEKIVKTRDGQIWSKTAEVSGGTGSVKIFSNRGAKWVDEADGYRFVGFRIDPYRTYEGYFKIDNLDFGVLSEVPLEYNHDVGSGAKSSVSAKANFVEDNQAFSLSHEGIDKEFELKYSIADGALFMKFVSLIDRLTFSRVPVWIVENYKSKKDNVYLCLASSEASTTVLVDEDGEKFYNIDLKFKNARRDL